MGLSTAGSTATRIRSGSCPGARVLSLDQSGSAWAEVGAPRPGDRPAPVGAAGAPPCAFSLALRGRRVVDPQPAQASNPGDRGSQTAFQRPTAACSSFPAAELEAFPTPDAAASGRRLSQPGAAAHRAPPRDRSSSPRRAGSTRHGCWRWQPEDAMAALQQLPGIGPMYAGLILLRSTGATDILTLGEPRMPVVRPPFLRARAPGDTHRDLVARRGVAPIPNLGRRAHPRRRGP